MSRLAQFLAYQAVWFAAVIGAGGGRAWPGLVAASLFVAISVGLSRSRGVLLGLVILALVMGAALDGAFAASGWLRYSAPWPSTQAAPAWILAMWAAFAATFPGALAFLQRRPVLAFVLGAVAGPLAYLGAARGWNAVVFVAPMPRTLAALALGWGVSTCLLALYARRRSPAPRAATIEGAMR
jgi:hypothetical protein